MADVNKPGVLVASEILCYLFNKFRKVPIRNLIAIVSDFYCSADISNAKDILINCVDNLKLDKWPRPVNRKKSDNKCKLEVEDIIGLMSYLDEQLLIDKLPAFVAVNIENLPSNRIEEGDMRHLLKKLDTIEEKVSSVQCSLKLHELSKNHGSGALRRDSTSMSWADKADPRHRDIAAQGSNSCNWRRVSVGDDDKQVVDSMDSDADAEMMAGTQRTYAQVVGRKKRRRENSDLQASGRQIDIGHQASALTQSGRKFKPKSIKGNASNCSLKTAKELIKKKVYCVSNLSIETNTEDVKAFIENLVVNPVSIFPSKTKFSNSMAFRICIQLDDTDKFCDPEAWGSHIVVREWVFKGKPLDNNIG